MEGRFTNQELIKKAEKRAKYRNKILKNRDKRRTNFPNLDSWENKQYGLFLKQQDHTIYIFKSKFNDTYIPQVNGKKIGDYLDTIESAKYAAFDYIWPPVYDQKSYIESNLTWKPLIDLEYDYLCLYEGELKKTSTNVLAFKDKDTGKYHYNVKGKSEVYFETMKEAKVAAINEYLGIFS
jgi:hypothetical protein